MTAPATSRARLWRWLPPALLLVAAAGVWELWVRLADTPAWLLPSPSAIARILVDDRGLRAHHARGDLGEGIVGFLVALIAGVLLAVAIDASPLTERAVYPLG